MVLAIVAMSVYRRRNACKSKSNLWPHCRTVAQCTRSQQQQFRSLKRTEYGRCTSSWNGFHLFMILWMTNAPHPAKFHWLSVSIVVDRTRTRWMQVFYWAMDSIKWILINFPPKKANQQPNQSVRLSSEHHCTCICVVSQRCVTAATYTDGGVVPTKPGDKK